MKIVSNNLYIVSTPIGNLGDITMRALEVLKKSDIILCEDTRHSIKLLSHYNIKKKLVAYHKFNEKKQTSLILKYFNEGKILSLISDAGTPLLSDPGKILINECIENKINITPIPGVSSITAAMSISGFKDQFLFYGFLTSMPARLAAMLRPLYLLFLNKWYFDELYDSILVRPAVRIGTYLWRRGDQDTIDGFGPDGMSALVYRLSGVFSRIQTGFVFHYAFAMLIGVVVMVTWYYFRFVGI